MLHMWRVPAPCSWIFQRTPRKDPTQQLGLAGCVGIFQDTRSEVPAALGIFKTKMGDEPSCPFVIFVCSVFRRFQHLVGDVFHIGKLHVFSS